MTSPGIYHGMSFEDYAAIDALNYSTLKRAIVSPEEPHSMKHLKAAIEGDNQLRQTDAMRLGRAIHARILEPDLFNKIPIQRKCSHIKKDEQRCTNLGKYTDEFGWYCGVRGHAPADVVEQVDYISEAEAKQADSVYESLRTSEVLHHLRSSGWSESVVVWEHKGQLLKSRIDRLSKDCRLILDIKTIQASRGSVDLCRKQIWNLRYDIQTAMNIDGVQAVTGVKPRFVWVFIEKSEPFDVQVIEADEIDHAYGAVEYQGILDRWKIANEQEQYYGYISNPRRIKQGRFIDQGVPGWVRQRDEKAGRDILAEFAELRQ